MTCAEFLARLDAFVDDELDVADTLAADVHAATCRGCQARVSEARRLRELLRRQPQERAPEELRARILAAVRAERRRAARRRWALGAGVAAVVLTALGGALALRAARAPASLVARLVDTHRAYATLAAPAEFAASRPAEVEAWFRRRLGLAVPVADLAGAGLRLLGGRVVAIGDRQAAAALYAKGDVLLSVVVVPAAGGVPAPAGRRVTDRGREYWTDERQGVRTVVWADVAGRRPAVVALVSALAWDALFECADRLRTPRASPGA